MIIGGAIASAWALRRTRELEAKRRMVSNLLIAVGTMILAAGGTLQGFLGKDQAFVTCTALGIAVIAVGTRRISFRRAATSDLAGLDAAPSH